MVNSFFALIHKNANHFMVSVFSFHTVMQLSLLQRAPQISERSAETTSQYCLQLSRLSPARV